MNTMSKTFLLAGLFLFASWSANAQCDECVSKLAYAADFCYADSTFVGICGQFAEKKPNFLIQNGKKAKYIPSVKIADDAYFVSLANDPKLKMTAMEILFLQKAIGAWEVESRKFGYAYKESGLGIKMIEEGTGELPKVGDRVTVHYTGYLENGTKFDSSVDRGKPFSFALGTGQVIKGWDEGVGMLKIGSKAFLRIPADLGYGSIARGQIPANATLIFEVEVIE